MVRLTTHIRCLPLGTDCPGSASRDEAFCRGSRDARGRRPHGGFGGTWWRRRRTRPVQSAFGDRLMAPEKAAAAVRAWAEETNRLNRECNAAGEADRNELADIEKKMATMISAIEDGGYRECRSRGLRG